MENFRLPALPLLMGLAANAAALSFLLVVLPALGRDLGFSGLETGLLLGLSALVLLLAAPIWGGIAETRGRRFVLVVGLLAASVGTALMAGIVALRLGGVLGRGPALALLFVVRAVQCALAGGLLPAAQAWMADRTSAENRAEGMGLLGASYGVGGIAGAAVAFGAGGTHPVHALLALAAAVTVGLLFVTLKLTDRLPVGDAPRVAPRIGYPLRDIWQSLLVTFLGITIYGIMQHVTALRLEDSFGLARADAIAAAGAALMGAGIAMAVMQVVGLRFIKLRPSVLMLIGAIAGAGAMLGVIFAPDRTILQVGILLMGGALGLLLPGNLALLSLIAGPQAQGRVAGVNAMAQGLGMAAGPVVGAAAYRWSPDAPAIFAFAALAVVALLAATLARRGKSA